MESISVSVRLRPLNKREISLKQSERWKSLSDVNSVVLLDSAGQPVNEKGSRFSYDNVFEKTSSNEVIFEKVGKRIVNGVVEGINGTIFAYGQTSSGKTYTMQGAKNDKTGGSIAGILQLSALQIFDRIEDLPQREYLIRVSYIEIYNENVRDLLDPNAGIIKIREDRTKGVYVECQEKVITSYEEILDLLERGDKHRHVGVTIMIEGRQATETEEVEEKETKTKKGCSTFAATLSLVDLAGSENARQTGAAGSRLKEGGNINRSLLALSRVIACLADSKGSKNAHINFRDSKLTRVLQPALAGNTRTALIACVTPAEEHIENTLSTMKFASRAKQIKNKVSVNEIMDDASMIRKLKQQIKKMQKALKEKGTGNCSEENEKKSNFKSNTKKAEQEVEMLRNQMASLMAEKEDSKQGLQKLKHMFLSKGILEQRRERAIHGLLDADQDALLGKRGKKKRKKVFRRETWAPTRHNASTIELPPSILAFQPKHSEPKQGFTEVDECESECDDSRRESGASVSSHHGNHICHTGDLAVLIKSLDHSDSPLVEKSTLNQKVSQDFEIGLEMQKQLSKTKEKMRAMETELTGSYTEIQTLREQLEQKLLALEVSENEKEDLVNIQNEMVATQKKHEEIIQTEKQHVQNLNKEKAEKESRVQELEKALSHAQSVIQDFKIEKKQSEESFNKMSNKNESKIVEYQSQLAELTEINGQQAKEIEAAKEVLENVSTENGEIQEENETLLEKIGELETINSNLKSSLTQEKSVNEAKISHLEKSLERLKESSADADMQSALLVEQEQSLARVVGEKKRLEEVLKEKIESIERMKHEHGETIEKLMSKHGEAMNTMKQEHDETIEKLTSKHDSAMDTIKQEHDKTMKKLTSEHDTKLNATIVNQNIKNVLNQLVQSVETTQLENQKQRLVNKISSFESELASSQSKLEALEKAQHDDLLKSQSMVEDQLLIITSLEGNMIRRDEEIERLKSENIEGLKMNEDSKTDLENVQQTLETTEQSLEKSKSEIEALKNQCETFKNEYETLNNQCSTLKNECSTLKNEYETLNNQCSTLKNECLTLKNERTKALDSNADLNKKCEGLELELQTLKYEAEAETMELPMVEHHEKEKELLEEQIATLNQQIARAEQARIEEIHSRKMEKTKLNSTVNNIKERVKQMNEEMATLRSRNKQLEKVKMTEEQVKKLLAMKKDRERLKVECKKLKSELLAVKKNPGGEEVRQAKEEVLSLRRDLSEAQVQLSQAQEEISQAQAQLSEAKEEEKMIKLKEKLREYAIRIKHLQERSGNNENEFAEREREFEEREKEREERERREKQMIKERMDVLKQKVRKYVELEAEMENLNTTIKTLNHNIETSHQEKIIMEKTFEEKVAQGEEKNSILNDKIKKLVMKGKAVLEEKQNVLEQKQQLKDTVTFLEKENLALVMKLRAFEEDETIAIPSATLSGTEDDKNKSFEDDSENMEDKENMFGSPLPDENMKQSATPKQSTTKSILGQAATPLLNLFSPSAAHKGEQQCQQQ